MISTTIIAINKYNDRYNGQNQKMDILILGMWK